MSLFLTQKWSPLDNHVKRKYSFLQGGLTGKNKVILKIGCMPHGRCQKMNYRAYLEFPCLIRFYHGFSLFYYYFYSTFLFLSLIPCVFVFLSLSSQIYYSLNFVFLWYSECENKYIYTSFLSISCTFY